jgi:hypothetical protein
MVDFVAGIERFHNWEEAFKAKDRSNVSTTKDLKFCTHANETAYHITKLDVDGLFWFESYFCDLQTVVHNVFYLLDINVKI